MSNYNWQPIRILKLIDVLKGRAIVDNFGWIENEFQYLLALVIPILAPYKNDWFEYPTSYNINE